jgi:cytochrome P450 family 9
VKTTETTTTSLANHTLIIFSMAWILITIAVLSLAYWLLIRPYKYWTKKGVVQGKPLPIFGDNWGPALRLQSNTEMVEMLYNIAPNERYCGIYQFITPTLMLRDPDLIKQITIKDFDHFLDHRSLVPEESDPLFGKNLFSLTGQKWRDMRSTLSPAFTSSKMKYMFELITKNGEQFAQHFLKQNKDLIKIEMKDTFTRFTNDVIASTAFGVECDSLGQPENEFYMMGRVTTDLTGIWTNIKLMGYFLMPRLCKLLRFKLFADEVGIFFNKLVKENIQSREKHGIVRPDMINLLMEARKNGSLKYEESNSVPDAGFATVHESEIGKTPKQHKIQITDQDITSQALIFFFGGFDSVSSLMCFMSYELGANPDVQEKLRQEIDETLKNCNGKLTYEALMNMKYMDMVTSETLRKWPNAPAIDRVCTKPYTIEPTSPKENPIHLAKNDILLLPIYGLHRDPKYFPDPERFDPERFSDENKNTIKPYSYIPFGSGPRNCIGSRFALLEAKTLFFYILANFEIVPTEKTKIPLVLSKQGFNMTAEGGFWFGFKRRTPSK